MYTNKYNDHSAQEVKNLGCDGDDAYFIITSIIPVISIHVTIRKPESLCNAIPGRGNQAPSIINQFFTPGRGSRTEVAQASQCK